MSQHVEGSGTRSSWYSWGAMREYYDSAWQSLGEWVEVPCDGPRSNGITPISRSNLAILGVGTVILVARYVFASKGPQSSP
jgi:hypothetical protein